MLSPKIADALLALETQKTLSLPMAALILGAVSQVESLIELADRICDPVRRLPSKTTTDGV
jgi:hypothetical protein